MYFTRANRLGSMKTVLDADKRAAEKINELLEMAELLKEYRQSLFERSQLIAGANYRLRLTLRREIHSYESRKFYRVELAKIFDRQDIEPETVLSERYAGTERHKAIKRFEDLRKSHPGIDVEKDIAKKQWEA